MFYRLLPVTMRKLPSLSFYNQPAWRYYFTLFGQAKPMLVISLITALLQAALLLPLMIGVAIIFNQAIPTSDVGLLIAVGVGLLVTYLLNGVVGLVNRYASLVITKRVIQNLRVDLVDRLYTFSQAFYTAEDASQLHTQMVQDTERLDIMSNQFVAQFLPSLIVAGILSIALITLNAALFALMVIVFPFLFLINNTLGKLLNRYTQRFRAAFESFSDGVLFSIQAMPLARAHAAESDEITRRRAEIDTLRIKSQSMAWLHAAYMLTHNILFYASGIIILVVGGVQAIHGALTVGDLITFYIAFGLLGAYLINLSNTIPHFVMGVESLYALYALVTQQDIDPYDGTQPILYKGGVCLCDVCFGYENEPLLKGIDLVINPGDYISIAGQSGAGKSTLINLIMGFYRPQSGIVCADDQPLEALDMRGYRQQIGVVTQDPILFSGTVAENIAYGTPHATREQLQAAALRANVHDFIMTLPDGYATLIGENGARLSGGQRQRIAIARALLKQPALLILDEPTNHLDERSRQHIMRALRDMPNAPTIIVISHQDDLLTQADRRYVLRDGALWQSDAQPIKETS